MPTRLQQPRLAVELVDATGSTAELRPNVRRTASAAAALAAGVELAELAGAASSCAPTRVRLRYHVKELAPLGTTGGQVVGVTGVLIFGTSDPEQFAVVAIPGIKESLRQVDNPHLLDITAPPLAALIDAIINGVFSNAFGIDIISCEEGLVEMRV